MRKGIWSPQFGETKKEDVIKKSLPHWAMEEVEQLSWKGGAWDPGLLPTGDGCVCVFTRTCMLQKLTYGLSSNSPWGRKTSGSASWGPRGFTLARMSRMERQGIFPELPQGLAPAEGSGCGEPSGPPFNVEEDAEMQG